MRTTLLIAAFGIALAAPAFAQRDVTTQTPPAPNSQNNQPDAAGSVPPGAGTASGHRPGDAVGRSKPVPQPSSGFSGTIPKPAHTPTPAAPSTSR